MSFSLKKMNSRLVITMLLGCMAGTLFFNLSLSNNINKMVVYGNYYKSILSSVEIDKLGFLKYIFTRRIKEMFIVAILGLTTYKLFFQLCYVFYFFIEKSIGICMFAVMFGGKGMIAYLILSEPHMVIYAYMIYRIIILSNDMYDNKTKIRQYLLIILCVLMVSMWECLVNYFFISNFI